MRRRRGSSPRGRWRRARRAHEAIEDTTSFRSLPETSWPISTSTRRDRAHARAAEADDVDRDRRRQVEFASKSCEWSGVIGSPLSPIAAASLTDAQSPMLTVVAALQADSRLTIPAADLLGLASRLGRREDQRRDLGGGGGRATSFGRASHFDRGAKHRREARKRGSPGGPRTPRRREAPHGRPERFERSALTTFDDHPRPPRGSGTRTDGTRSPASPATVIRAGPPRDADRSRKERRQRRLIGDEAVRPSPPSPSGRPRPSARSSGLISRRRHVG